MEEFYSILESPSHIFSNEERKAIKDVVFDGIPDEKRQKFWQKCTGIHAYRDSYVPQYYETLCAADKNGDWEQYPNVHFAQIDKDLTRTFPGDPYYNAEIQQSMRRILRAYVWRNPSVGYIQGINFPFFRLRKWLSEEDTFWAMCVIIESYMPLDFYIEMYGAKSHALILNNILVQNDIIPEFL